MKILLLLLTSLFTAPQNDKGVIVLSSDYKVIIRNCTAVTDEELRVIKKCMKKTGGVDYEITTTCKQHPSAHRVIRTTVKYKIN